MKSHKKSTLKRFSDFQVIQFNNDSLSVSSAPNQRASFPALYKLFRIRKDQKNSEEVKPHPILAKLFCPQKFDKIRFLTNELPMLVPPVPWMSTTQGGFLLDNTRYINKGIVIIQTSYFESYPFSFVRAPDDFYYSHVESAKLETCLQSVYPIFDCLNQLGSTPWKINGPVLDLVKKKTGTYLKSTFYWNLLSQKVSYIFKNQTSSKFTKEILSNLSIPLNDEKLNLTQGVKIKVRFYKITYLTKMWNLNKMTFLLQDLESRNVSLTTSEAIQALSYQKQAFYQVLNLSKLIRKKELFFELSYIWRCNVNVFLSGAIPCTDSQLQIISATTLSIFLTMSIFEDEFIHFRHISITWEMTCQGTLLSCQIINGFSTRASFLIQICD